MFDEQLRAFADKTKNKLVQAHKLPFIEVAERMTTTQPSISFIGTYEEGKVPVLTGALVGTSEAKINDVVVATGVVAGASSKGPDFNAAFSSMQIGDSLQANFTQPYGPNVEYGIGIRGGRFMVRGAVLAWPEAVNVYAGLLSD